MQGCDCVSFDVEIFRKNLKTRKLGRILHYVSHCETTMTLLPDDTPSGALVLAERQTGGLGRGGRTFRSEMGGNLYATLHIECEKEEDLLKYNFLLPIAICNALDGAIAEICPSPRPRGPIPRCMTKWPNDVVVDKSGLKVGGVLIDVSQKISATEGQSRILGRIGFGLNILADPSESNSELKSIATSLFQTMAGYLESNEVTFSRERILAAILSKLEELSELHSTQTIIDLYKENSICIGRRLAVIENQRVAKERTIVEGIGITDYGELLVLNPDGTQRTLSSNHVTVRLLE